MSYFSMFPLVDYDNKKVLDITRRAVILDEYQNDPYVFLPYVVQDGERAFEIAHYYYGHVKYTWLVYMSNGIIDPYYEWPMTSSEFDKHLISTYAELSGKSGTAVIDWCMNETIIDNIHHFEDKTDPSITLSADSMLNPAFSWDNLRPVRIYEFEHELNESKRTIKLLDSQYLSRVTEQMKSLLMGE